MSEESTAYPEPGDVLEGKYEIQRVLGTGAMGAVVRATHLLRKAPVALKFMSPEVMNKKGVVQRFLNEGVAASQIDSDHVVKVFDVCELSTGVPYLVMEYLEGVDLKELLDREGNPGLGNIPRAVHFTLQILRGLQVAHRVNIVHRDMKPANVFVVNKDGEPDFVKIVDFGISKIKQPDQIELTNVGSALGTPLYMSPEQARSPKDVDARSDLYAVAAILYELVAGQPPFVPESGTLSELMIKLGTEEPVSLEETHSDLPAGFWATVAHGLAKRPENRYQSALAFAEAIAPFADERSNHTLRQLSSRTASGMSRFPPAPGPPTQVDAAPAGADGEPVDGTLVIGDGVIAGGVIADGHDAPLAGGVAAALSNVGSIAGSAVVTAGGAAVDVVADTQQGTVQDAEATERSGKPIAWVMLGAAALIASVTVAFFVTSEPSNATAPTATPTTTAADLDTAAPVAPNPTTPIPTASASALSTVEAQPPSVPKTPGPTTPVPTTTVPKTPVPTPGPKTVVQPPPVQPPPGPKKMGEIGITD
jgi:eukaryotic-like serine/threonine-protein kinase